MNVYVLLVSDRHADPAATVYADRELALAAARTEAAENGWSEDELTIVMVADRWLFAASHPTEGDTLQLVETEVLGNA